MHFSQDSKHYVLADNQNICVREKKYRHDFPLYYPTKISIEHKHFRNLENAKALSDISIRYIANQRSFGTCVCRYTPKVLRTGTNLYSIVQKFYRFNLFCNKTPLYFCSASNNSVTFSFDFVMVINKYNF